MGTKVSKTEAVKEIEKFFRDLGNKTSNEIKKIKSVAMSHNIPLKEKKKLFCKKCLTPYKNSGIRIRNKIKSVKCKDCDYVSRWKIKTS